MEYYKDRPINGFIIPSSFEVEDDNPYIEKVVTTVSNRGGLVRKKIRDINLVRNCKKELWELYRQLSILEEIDNPDQSMIDTKTIITHKIFYKRGELGSNLERIKCDLDEEENRINQDENIRDKEIHTIIKKYQRNIGEEQKEKVNDSRSPINNEIVKMEKLIEIEPDIRKLNEIIKNNFNIV